MFSKVNLNELAKVPRFKFYFRYKLRHNDFHEVRNSRRLLGRYAAKPLYGQLTAKGRVDRSVGFNGKIAVIFIPARARAAKNVKLVLTRLRKDRITLPNGHRNWAAIKARAEQAIRKLAV
jgi:hypothetical protein